MITLLIFFALWICTAKDIKGIRSLTALFIVVLIATMFITIPRACLMLVLAFYIAFAVYALAMPWPEYPVKKHRSWYKRWIKHPREILAYRMFVWIFNLMPLPMLSWIGGKALEIVGPFTRGQKRIIKNLGMVMPENNNPKFIKSVWNNWGRTFVEGLKYGTFQKHADKYLNIVNWELAEKHKQFIFAVPHIGFMALATIPFANRGIKMGITYKYPSNPLTNELIISSYGYGHAKSLHYIHVGNAMPMIRTLKNGELMSINSDQRVHGADYIDFMGVPARTSTGTAQLARKFNLPIIVAYAKRKHGVYHDVIFTEAINVPHTDDAAKDVLDGTKELNAAFGRAIAKAPESYLWMHRRWK